MFTYQTSEANISNYNVSGNPEKQLILKATESSVSKIETWVIVILYDSDEWRETHVQFLDLIKLQNYDFRVNFNFYKATTEPFSLDEILQEKKYKRAKVILERILS